MNSRPYLSKLDGVRSLRFVAVAAAAVGLGAGAAGARTTPEAGVPMQAKSAPNLVVNGSFESRLTGWAGYGGKLAVVPGIAGKNGVRVTAARSATTFSILVRSRPVRGAAAGATFFAGARIRSFRPGVDVCLRIREWHGSSSTRAAQICRAATRTWRQLPALRYTVAAADADLDVYLYVMPAASGDSFDVDGVSLTRDVAAATLGNYPTASPPTGPPPSAAAPATTAGGGGGGGGTATTPAATAPAATATPSSAALQATGLDNAHVKLDWPAVAGAASYRVSRGALVLGTTTATAFTDALLWPETAYSYSVDALGPSGAVVATKTATGSTKPLPASGFQRFFPASSFWNVPVPSSPRLNANSAPMIAWFVAHARFPNLVIGDYGVSVAEAHPTDPVHTVPCTLYSCSLGAFGAFRIPVTAKADPSADGHLAVYDPDSQREWGMWQARLAGGSWSASAGAAVSLLGDGVAPRSAGAGANAAGFPLLGGLVRPEEILQGHIDHALVFAIGSVKAGPAVCPAARNAGDGTDAYGFREGQKIQLDPAVDVDALLITRWQKVVLKAAQEYGMYLRDGGGTLGIYAENPLSRGYDAWALAGVPTESFFGSSVPWNKFRVIDAPDC
jgi:hypothetical protein